MMRPLIDQTVMNRRPNVKVHICQSIISANDNLSLMSLMKIDGKRQYLIVAKTENWETGSKHLVQ